MSPVAYKLLSAAYGSYIKTRNIQFTYYYKNGNDLFDAIAGARQLSDEGYICNVSDFVFEDSFSVLEPILFSISNTGIEYMRTNGEL